MGGEAVKVEFRSSNPATACRECGAQELIHTTHGAALDIELASLTSRAFDRLERELIAIWEEEKMSLSEAMDSERRQVTERINREHAEFEERVTALLGERAPRVRVVKRRWQSDLDARFRDLVADLRANTTHT